LISLANDAGTFKDQMLRARTLAQVADLIWQTDADRARALFRQAWHAAEIADADAQQRMQEEAREQQAKSGGYAVTSPPDVRKQVLHLAVKHERSLGEEFLAKRCGRGQTTRLPGSRQRVTGNRSHSRMGFHD
jgi:hypothetical protein